MWRILLVEDNEMNRDMLSRRLAKRGHKVSIAIGGGEAITMARRILPDVILMDMRLPDIHGGEATRTLKTDPSTAEIPIIALTANALEGDRERALAYGCDDYDTKPVNLERLLTKIEAALVRIDRLDA
ncbi:MAG TPA: response regulator [Tepidisphaeraceae bacterium]|jgi:CheY-like chemotaxis protein